MQIIFTLQEKLDIIFLYEELSQVRSCELWADFTVLMSTVCTMVKSKDAIRNTVEVSSPRAQANIVKLAHDPYVLMMEKSLFMWMEDCWH